MYLFLLLCFPLGIGFFVVFRSTQSDHPRRTGGVLFAGALAGVVYCGMSYFLVFPSHGETVSFARIFGKALVQGVVPMGAVYALFCLVLRNSVGYKPRAFFPLTAAFYAVLVPFRVLNSVFLPGLFDTLVLPLVYLTQIIALAACCLRRYPSPTRMVLVGGSALFFLVLPAAIEGLRAVNPGMLPVFLLTALFYAATALLLHRIRNSLRLEPV
jgi:hypothetical protein